MRTGFPIFILFLFGFSCQPEQKIQDTETQNFPITLVIHGGAGTIKKETMTPQREETYRKALQHALDTGFSVLNSGGKSTAAVIAAVTFLENCPLFNAGKGAVFTRDGRNELDASIMDGSTLNAGAVAGVTNVKNPIQAAFAVMTQSEHVMLMGRGAEQFAAERGLEIVDPSYFIDSTRYRQYLNRRDLERKKKSGYVPEDYPEKKFGTVGAVALDQFGNLAAATSTGGMAGKQYGRVGDSPVIGAGTYANNNTCAISATGWGEYFIRLAVAHDIAAMMEYGNATLQEAASRVVMEKLPALGGDGGVIGIDRSGNITMTFNTNGMYRGYIRSAGKAKTFLYKD